MLSKEEILNLQTRVVCIQLKPNSVQKVREWQNYLNSHKEEVLKSLSNEGVFLETACLFNLNKDYFLFYYMKFSNYEKVKQAFNSSILEIDKYHKQFKIETWEKIELLEPLIDFINIDM